VSRERKDTPAGKQPHSLATRQRRLVALRSFLRFASLEEWTTRDLTAAIDLPKLPQRLPKPLEDADRERLVHDLPAATMQEQRDRALVFLLLSTGARISEILRLDRRLGTRTAHRGRQGGQGTRRHGHGAGARRGG
jgi:site-specific recombinase XerD